ncbi:glycine cleavage system protein GcvH [Ruminococcaceae bacterium OttesenSCG-928-I18]|nr:glycine cleavage system protein GcvH [Ruminococcaceae bacterium OttesenSCG-928-I18]
MNAPSELKYTKSHEWVQFTADDTARIGLTDYAQDSLGSLVFINLPEEGDSLSVGDNLGDVESVKAVSDVVSPVSGTVVSINEELLDAPEKINDDPYGAWLVEVNGITEKEEFLDSAAYTALVEEQA